MTPSRASELCKTQLGSFVTGVMMTDLQRRLACEALQNDSGSVSRRNVSRDLRHLPGGHGDILSERIAFDLSRRHQRRGRSMLRLTRSVKPDSQLQPYRQFSNQSWDRQGRPSTWVASRWYPMPLHQLSPGTYPSYTGKR